MKQNELKWIEYSVDMEQYDNRFTYQKAYDNGATYYRRITRPYWRKYEWIGNKVLHILHFFGINDGKVYWLVRNKLLYS